MRAACKSASSRQAAGSLQRYRCQKQMITEVQMGLDTQHSWSSLSVASWSASSSTKAERSTARTAVNKLQLSWLSFISSNTSFMRSVLKAERRGAGAFQNSATAPSYSMNCSPHWISPSKRKRPVDSSTCITWFEVCKPVTLLVLSKVFRSHSGQGMGVGRTVRNSSASSPPPCTSLGWPSTTRTWPRYPPTAPMAENRSVP
mmetsp:Transcript_19493/g.31136  ORF Transcript_19493/g.31136 Transcript_19493/m.31136 type:complete len:202 (-) Transcript_19493:448-1053(-)